MLTILLIILGVMVFIGIIRIILKPSESFGDLLLDLFLLDWLGDLLGAIIDGISDSLD